MKRIFGWIVTTTLLTGMAGLGRAQPATSPGQNAPSAGPAVFGRVKAASSDSLTVLVGRARQEETFTIDATTTVEKASQTIPVTALAPDDLVRVVYRSVDGKKTAASVSVRPPRDTGGRRKNPDQPSGSSTTP